MRPARGGSADRHGFIGSTYTLEFSVTNRGDIPISVVGEVVVQEFDRSGARTAKTNRYVSELKNIAPGATRVVTDSSFPTDLQIGTADAVATLYLKTVSGQEKKEVAATNYRIG